MTFIVSCGMTFNYVVNQSHQNNYVQSEPGVIGRKPESVGQLEENLKAYAHRRKTFIWGQLSIYLWKNILYPLDETQNDTSAIRNSEIRIIGKAEMAGELVSRVCCTLCCHSVSSSHRLLYRTPQNTSRAISYQRRLNFNSRSTVNSAEHFRNCLLPALF